MIILMIKGFSGSGKDTFGQCFVQNYDFERFAFADSLKVLVSQKYAIDEHNLHSQVFKQQLCPQTGTTWRSILIEEAKIYREQDPNIFATMCASDIEASNCDRIVITDWRYPNEYNVLRSAFPYAIIVTIHIRRIGQEKSPVNDQTEYLLENVKCDFTIENNGISNLIPKADEIMKAFHLYSHHTTQHIH